MFARLTRVHLTAVGLHSARQPLRQKLIRDSFNYFLSKSVPGIMGFCSVLVFVRLVGNAEYGRYSVLFAIVTSCTAGLSTWLPQGILRYFSTSHTDREVARFKSATLLGLLLSMVIGVFVLATALWFERQPFWRSILGELLLAAGMLYGVFIIELQAMLKSHEVALFEAMRSIFCFVVPLCIILLAGKRNAAALLTGVLFGYILPLGVAWWRQGRTSFLRTDLAHHSSHDSFRILKTLWTYGWPVGIWSMCLTLQSAIDRYFIQHYSGDANAGSYAAMYDVIVRSFSLLCFPLVMSSNSLVMERWNKGDRSGAVSIIESSLKYQAVISVLFLLGLIVLAQQVNYVILGGRRESSTASLVLPLAIGGFLWQVSYFVHKPLELMCRTKRMLSAMIGALMVSVGGNYMFIPMYGYTAAAYVAIAAPLAYLVVAVALTPMNEFRREVSVGAVPLVVAETGSD